MPPPALGADFEPALAATISGTVYWRGELPVCPPFGAQGPGADGVWRTTLVPNPNAPAINARTRAVEGAVVYLDAVPPNVSRPWDHPPVCVSAEKDGLHIEQGDGSRFNVGWVRRGADVELVSRRSEFESIVARGAAFFSLPFPHANKPLRRRLNETGLVELTSGAGRFWLRAYVFVAEHPYYCRTDALGRFTLDRVPPGEYRLMSWLPNPEVAQKDRDPNLGHVIRHHHAAGFEQFQNVVAEPRATLAVNLSLGR